MFYCNLFFLFRLPLKLTVCPYSFDTSMSMLGNLVTSDGISITSLNLYSDFALVFKGQNDAYS